MRLDARNEFVIAINFSNRPLVGWVEVMHDQEFKPLKIKGMQEASPSSLPLFRLNGFEWRIYQRTVP